MAVAWLITGLALIGIMFGALGYLRAPSAQFAAAGGGLLSGIGVFWLLPEISASLGWLHATALLLTICLLLLLLDRAVGHHKAASPRTVVAPLLAATALHSFLDGWSVRALAVVSLANIAVPVGLALHKIPEGLALGWITRRTVGRTALAIGVASAVELLTPMGAFVEPYAEHSGFLAFGPSWTALILAIAAGSFLFLGLHSVLEERRNKSALLIFLAVFGVVGVLARFGKE